MSKKTKKVKVEKHENTVTTVETAQAQEAPTITGAPESGVKEEPTQTATVQELNLNILKLDIDAVKQTVNDHGRLIAEIQELLARKRKPTQNGKIQIRDKQTGKVYKSKNNCYQSLLKAGELKDLVAKGIFGADPQKNNFGWFALQRAWPDRFEEVKPDVQES